MLIHVYTTQITFIGFGHRSKFKVTRGKCSFLAMDAHYDVIVHSDSPVLCAKVAGVALSEGFF